MNCRSDAKIEMDKRVNWVLLLRCAVVFVVMFSGVAQAAKPGDRIGDWLYVCDANINAAKGTCYISQNVEANKGKKRLILATGNIGYLFRDKKMGLVTLLPLDAWRVDIQSPVRIDVDEKKRFVGKIDTCFPDACRARFALDRFDLTAFMRGKVMGVSFKLITGKPVRIELSLKGITKAVQIL